MKKVEKIKVFCSRVKSGIGSIVDKDVKTEYERVNEETIHSYDLAFLLAVLEQNELLDTRNAINCDKFFYRKMYQKLVETAKKVSEKG
jgi:hypothetical protein